MNANSKKKTYDKFEKWNFNDHDFAVETLLTISNDFNIEAIRNNQRNEGIDLYRRI